MSCPDWRTLTPESPSWDAAVAHFDGGCRLCRRDALKAEPTLVFRQLRSGSPAAPVMSAAQEASEVDAVRQAVAAMRTASRVDSIEHRSRRFGWKRWAVAAALAAAALSIPADNAWRHLDAQRLALASQPASQPATMLRGGVLPAAYGGEADPQMGRPGARVYHMDGDGMSVVMIVDESLDV
jgi:hypothetical protein